MPDRADNMPHAPLSGRSILVVGGSSGIGLACARACSHQGACVTVTSHDAATLAEVDDAFGGRITTMKADARQPESAADAIDRVLQRSGRFDGLVHVAGGSGRSFGDGPVHAVTDEGWHKTLDLNLSSVFYSNRAAVRRFLETGKGGAIVNLGSVLAFSPAAHFFATHAYAAAKAGLEGLGRAIAANYAGDDIRVNTVVSGLADTPMARRAMGDPAIRSFVASKQPLDGGRAARPEDYGAAVAFLLSDGARFITGQTLGIDGGWAISDGQIPPASAASAHSTIVTETGTQTS